MPIQGGIAPFGDTGGGGVMSGPLVSPAGGRTDILPIDVAAGSYVIPADVVSGIPGAQGSSLAGHNALNKLFSSFPLGADQGPYGVQLKKGPGTQPMIPGLRRALRHEYQSPDQQDQTKLLNRGGIASKGGRADGEGDWRHKPPVSIMAAGGEHVVPPHVVEAIGAGDLDRGHRILDRFCMEVRKKNIKDLKSLPPPAKK